MRRRLNWDLIVFYTVLGACLGIAIGLIVMRHTDYDRHHRAAADGGESAAHRFRDPVAPVTGPTRNQERSNKR